MATKTVIRRDDDGVERVVEREPTEIRVGGGMGAGAVIVAFAVLAIVAMIAFFLADMNRSDAMRTDAVTSAASTMSQSAGAASRDIGDAAKDVGSAVNATADSANQAARDSAPPPANPPSDSTPPR
jgi:hypothetical protein